MSIALSSRGHSCIALERNGSTLVLDPGAFSDPAGLRDADAVLITHDHQDHLAVEPLVAALTTAEQLHVWAPAAAVEALVAAGADVDRVHTAMPGDAFEAAGFAVRVLDAPHALIHPDFGPMPNLAYLVDGVVLHPGDSFTPAPEGTALQVLLAPVSGPWMKLSEAADYVRAVGAPVAVPIHDAILSSGGLSVVDGMMAALVGASRYRRLAAGETLDVETLDVETPDVETP